QACIGNRNQRGPDLVGKISSGSRRIRDVGIETDFVVAHLPLERGQDRYSLTSFYCVCGTCATTPSCWSNWFDATSNDCGRSGKVAYCLLAQACNVVLESGQSAKGRYKIRSYRETNSQWMLSVSEKYSDSE